MDQLKKALAIAQKQAFWIISALTVVLSSVAYFMSRSSMDATFTTQSTAITSQYSTLQAISNEAPTHPNKQSHEGMEKLITSLLGDVKAAWEQQYQRQSKLLVWDEGPLGKSFVDKVKTILKDEKHNDRPIEVAVKYPITNDPLSVGQKKIYARYFDQQFPRLAKIIGVEWVGKVSAAGASAGGYGAGMPGAGGDGYDPSGGMTGPGAPGGGFPGSSGMPGAPGMATGPRKDPDLVTWLKPSQDKLLSEVQMWKGEEPNTLEILYTQENIWVLEGLLNIIAKVNEGARANFQTKIKEIEFIRIGRPAVGNVGTIDRPNAGGGVGMMGSGGMAPGGIGMGMTEDGSAGADMASGMSDGGSGSMYAGEGGDGAGVVAVTPDPANGRYVDANFTPLKGEELRAKMESSAPDDALFAVAKRVPVRVRFKVDTRYLSDIVAEFGNAALLFEVRQVRFGKTIPAPSAGGGGGYGSDGYGSSGGGGMNAAGMGSDGSSGAGLDMGGGSPGGPGMPGYGNAAPAQTGFDDMIELYGIVYLFNPVDTAKFGLEKVTENTQVDGAADSSAAEGAAAAGAAAQNGAAAGVATPNGGAPNAAVPNPNGGAGVVAPLDGNNATPPAGGVAPAGNNPQPPAGGIPGPAAAPGGGAAPAAVSP